MKHTSILTIDACLNFKATVDRIHQLVLLHALNLTIGALSSRTSHHTLHPGAKSGIYLNLDANCLDSHTSWIGGK